MGFVFGPELGAALSAAERLLRLLASAAVLGVTLELLTVPLDFYSGFLLEHRYQLSNQSFGGWLWKRCKGYLVGGVFGLLLVYGLYCVLWVDRRLVVAVGDRRAGCSSRWCWADCSPS